MKIKNKEFQWDKTYKTIPNYTNYYETLTSECHNEVTKQTIKMINDKINKFGHLKQKKSMKRNNPSNINMQFK